MNPRGLLVDGGGTLFAESVSVSADTLTPLARALARVVPELDANQRRDLVAELWAVADASAHARVQLTDSLSAKLLEATRPGLGLRAAAIRHTLARDGSQRMPAFPGAREMLGTAKQLGLATVLLSNTAWVCEQDYRVRMKELGLAQHLDHLVSSFDVGFRKPHRAMFDAALERLGRRADECVMVGDSEVNDIAPAADLGMRTIRVTVQHPLQGTSRAEAVAESLEQVGEILRSWCAGSD